MNNSLSTLGRSALCLVTFFLSFTYSLTAPLTNTFLLGSFSLTFVFALLGVGYFLLLCASRDDKFCQSFLFLGLLTLSFQAGFILGTIKLPADSELIWQLDSRVMHVPWAMKYMSFFQGELPLKKIPMRPGLLSHTYFGLMFFIFNAASITSTLIGLTLLKLGTVFFIFLSGKRLFGNSAAFLAGAVYVLNPIVIFYTDVYYKEAMVHFLVALSVFLVLLFQKEKKLWPVPAILLLMYYFFFERSYVAPFIYLTLASLAILSLRTSLLRQKLLISAILLVAFGIIYYTMSNFLSPSLIISKLNFYREKYMGYHGFNVGLNYEIPYFLAVIKTALGPYFSLNKFKIYGGFAYLLIWGAWVNHLLQISFWIAVVKGLRTEKWKYYFSFSFPYLILILFMAYVAPWNVRVRDSLFPLIALVLGNFILENFKRTQTPETAKV